MIRRAALCIATTALMVHCTLLEGADNLHEVPCVTQCDSGSIESDASSNGAPVDDGSLPGPLVDAGDATDGSVGFHDAPSGIDSGATDSSTDAPGTPEGGIDATPPSTIASRYAAAVMADGPIGYWPLGDSTTSSSCADVSGNGHNGTLQGDVGLGAPGPFADHSITASSFTADQAYIDLGATFSFSGSTPFAWEIWARPNVLPASAGAFMSAMQYTGAGGPFSGEYLIAYNAGGNTLGFEMWNQGSTPVSNQIAGNGGLVVSQWSYIVATWNGSDTAQVYVNGASAGIVSSVTSMVPPLANIDTLLGQFFSGAISEVAIYPKMLTLGQVQAHWKAGTTP
jgi:hypothetical protein